MTMREEQMFGCYVPEDEVLDRELDLLDAQLREQGQSWRSQAHRDGDRELARMEAKLQNVRGPETVAELDVGELPGEGVLYVVTVCLLVGMLIGACLMIADTLGGIG